MNELDKIISDIIKTKPSIVDEFSIWVIIYEHINIKINYSKNVWINGEHVGFVSENIFNEMIDYNEYFKKNSKVRN